MLDDSQPEGDSQAKQLERMKGEFLIAQQRRRERAPEPASRPDDTNDGPLQEGPAAGGPTGIAAVRR